MKITIPPQELEDKKVYFYGSCARIPGVCLKNYKGMVGKVIFVSGDEKSIRIDYIEKVDIDEEDTLYFKRDLSNSSFLYLQSPKHEEDYSKLSKILKEKGILQK